MRIVGGRLRGLQLTTGAEAGATLRPTSDRSRESLFNILAHNDRFRRGDGPAPHGLAVLDVFAGSGALGLEAWSRGAKTVGFIENDGGSLSALKTNQKRAKASIRDVVIYQRDATAPGPAPARFDLVLMDPPYQKDLAPVSLAALVKGGWLTDGALIVVETDKREKPDWPEGVTVLRERKSGRAMLWFLEYAAD